MMTSPLDELLVAHAPDNVPQAVNYPDCIFYEPINWLYPTQNGRAPREETWALELFFRGPNGERGGQLFAQATSDPEKTLLLDKIALLSLRQAVLGRLLDEFSTLKLSINVTILAMTLIC